MKKRIVVDQDLPRLDAFLAKRLTGYSRVFLKDMIGRGNVTLDGARVDADQPIEEGQVVDVELPETASSSGEDFESWVLYEDKRLLVLNKPSGLLMHPLGDSWLKSPEAARAGRETNLAAELQVHRPAILKAGTPRCGIVHRLDRPTSGVLAVAKDPESYAALVDMFKERFMDKTYRAIVRGAPPEKVRVQAPIGREPGLRRVVVTPLGKTAETDFRVVSKKKSGALVEAKPRTGRTHQIRAHLAHLGHPVMGDPEFDRRGVPTPPRLMLHAYRLSFEHPFSGRPARFEAPAPADFLKFWKTLK
ncbi:MAG: RluA family pseudouridine synthase [Elusimicrobiota bacterium]|nr:MAG: RluA family pseudouridine synthase [Elusimicrobiota bacterium]